MPRHLARVLAIIAVLVAALVAAPSASAGALISTTTDCDEQVPEQPFLPWGDIAQYVPAPNGIVEGSSRWKMRGDAAVTRGNERFYVHEENDQTSLSLPPGSSATTASMCVGIEYPAMRFFTRNRGSLFSALVVEVLYEDAAGEVRSMELAKILAGPEWQPTPPLPLVVNLLPLLPGERTAVAFRFTPTGSYGDWSVDDVYVDPWRHR